MYPDIRTGRYVLIAVTDTGSGMSEEVRQRAFEPFFTTKPTGAGTGLGLSMVYGFVKQSGGNIQIYSELGQGTSVRIFLPLAEADQAKARRPGQSRHWSRNAARIRNDPRSSRTTRACAGHRRKRLRSLGYQIIEADNGAAALALLGVRPEIAMIFTDIVMPGGMNGDELAEAALAAKPGLKILFTSGYAEPAIARIGLKAAVWLKKPYTADELAEKIRAVLHDPET